MTKTKDLICDTNVWYKIGFGDTDPKCLKAKGYRLLATPLSLLELISKMDEANFKARRNAAKAIVEHADEILPDPEHHLAMIWSVTTPYNTFDWDHGIKTLASATSLSHMKSGVLDSFGKTKTKVNTDYATAWRVDRYDKFVEDMLGVVDTFWTGYKDARLNGKSIHMPREFGEMLDKGSSHPEQFVRYILATYARVLRLPEDEEIVAPRESIVSEAMRQLNYYARVYQKYVVRLATINTPKPNDLGDLECFLYAQDGRRVFTFDKNWNEIAIDADCQGCIFDHSIL